jgi:hypothetical protein
LRGGFGSQRRRRLLRLRAARLLAKQFLDLFERVALFHKADYLLAPFSFAFPRASLFA